MNSIIYSCEPTIEGFFSAVFLAYSSKEDALITSQGFFQSQIGDVVKNIATDLKQAQRVKNGILARDLATYEAVELAYANANPQKEDIIYSFLRLFFEKGRDTQNMFNLPSVIAFNDLVKQTTIEVHRFRGFLRFRQMSNGAYYGVIEPDNDVLRFILPHFCDRFNSQRFVIHDAKRAKIAVYDGENTRIFSVEGEPDIDLSHDEQDFLRLFKKYLQSVNIKQRQNLRLQNAFLPKRYRRRMLELEDK